MTATTHHVQRRGAVARERLLVALCRVASQDEEKEARAYVEQAGYAVLPGSILERAVYRDAHNRGQAVTETKFSAANARADALIGRLLHIIGEKVKARVLARNARDKTA